MKKRGFDLVLSTSLVCLLCWGCEDATGTDVADAAGVEDGGGELNVAETILGDWENFYSDSSVFSGTIGARLVYSMFVDEKNVCTATCNPPPDPPTTDCGSSDYDCECNEYTLLGPSAPGLKPGFPEGDGYLCLADACTQAVTFEENGQVLVFTGQAAGSGATIVNKLRKTDSLPAAVEACKEQVGR